MNNWKANKESRRRRTFHENHSNLYLQLKSICGCCARPHTNEADNTLWLSARARRVHFSSSTTNADSQRADAESVSPSLALFVVLAINSDIYYIYRNYYWRQQRSSRGFSQYTHNAAIRLDLFVFCTRCSPTMLPRRTAQSAIPILR